MIYEIHTDISRNEKRDFFTYIFEVICQKVVSQVA